MKSIGYVFTAVGVTYIIMGDVALGSTFLSTGVLFAFILFNKKDDED